MSQASALELLVRQDRLVLVAGLSCVVILAWVYILSGAGMDMSMPGMVMAPMSWSPTTAMLMFAMWWIMMIAMMVPSAAPAVLLFLLIRRKQATLDNPPVDTGVFVAGYLVVWAGFSLIATTLQWALQSLGLMSMDMKTNSLVLGGLLLIAAGLYQFTFVKRACLQHCQNPLLFFSSHWRSGAGGAFLMGLQHGAYCLGCCWFLMALLFFGGVMNILWIAGIAIYVGMEKLLPRYNWLSTGMGIVLSVAGMVVISRAVA